MNGFRSEGGFENGYEGESGLFSEIEKLFAQYIEIGASWNPQKLASVKAQLYKNFKQMGVLGSSGNLIAQAYDDLVCRLASVKDTTVKPDNFPQQEIFKEKYKEILGENPDFAKIEGRMGKLPEEYLYGVGILMANRPVYEALFEDDPIIVRKGQVENGRHRSLAKDVLDRCNYNTSNWSWVKTETEKK